MSNQPDHEPIAPALIEDVCARLAANKKIRQPLPGGGMLNIDRLLPFLCVYRRNPAIPDAGTGTFVTAEASYLLAPGDAPLRSGLKQLIKRIAETVAQQLGSFLILEVWAGSDHDVPREVDPITGESQLPRPGFRILTRRPHRPEGTVATLEYALQRIKLNRQSADVEINLHARNHPPTLTQIVSEAEEKKIGCYVLGLEVRPVYRGAESGEVYHQVLQKLGRGVARSLKKAFFEFALHRTSIRPQHYFSLGRSSLPQQVMTIDRQLAEISSQFKFLLLVTPINAERSWHEFVENRFLKQPQFCYRPLNADPMLLKRRLMKIATERVVDPTLSYLMRQTQDELDRQITMLGDIGTKRFLPGSLQVFGGVQPELLGQAKQILTALPVREAEAEDNPPEAKTLDAKSFVRQANREIEYYQSQAASFTAKAIIRDDIYSGLMSVGGNLLVGHGTNILASRSEALLQHEVGTHLVTYYNGAAQPLRLLKVGLAGYDSLQEGLAVLSEYLVGGLSRTRMRTLAARVVATDSLIRGEPFGNTFSLLVDQHGLSQHAAYTMVVRIYRGGGLTKDATYLHGLVEILKYVGKGSDLSPLFIGKFAADHIPVIRELLLRGVLRAPILRPRYAEDAACVQRLGSLNAHSSVLNLIDTQLKKED